MIQNAYVYCAWFRDTNADSDDQDSEWPACFVVEASTATDALAWGDVLAKDYARRRVSEVYLRSNIEKSEMAAGDRASLPVVPAGHHASDEEIGW